LAATPPSTLKAKLRGLGTFARASDEPLFLERILTVSETCRMQGRSVHEFVIDAVTANFDSLRRPDGGYGRTSRNGVSSTYQTFLIALIHQLLQRPLPDPKQAIDCTSPPLPIPPLPIQASTMHNKSMAALIVQHLSKSYPSPAGPQLEVLSDVTFSLRSGENMAILGPSGSGKSTLLAILGTLESPTSGHLLLEETDPSQLDPRNLALFRSRNIGLVFQDHLLLPQCTVLENVLVPYLADGTAQQAEVADAKTLINQIGLSDRMHHRPAQLSGGERQRVAIARAMVRRPTLLLADEPTGNLDGKTAEGIAQLLLELQEEAMLIVVTHSDKLAEKMQRKYELEQGLLVPIDQ
jgi:lipoprotein-releasing system ATP-binding protein